jgi:hypothetical protein
MKYKNTMYVKTAITESSSRWRIKVTVGFKGLKILVSGYNLEAKTAHCDISGSHVNEYEDDL